MDIGTAGVVWIDPPPDEVKEYWWNLWYNAKHGPERFRLAGVLAWRRFEMVSGMPNGLAIPDEYKYFTLSDQRDTSVFLSQEAKDLVAANIAESEEANTGEALHVAEARWVSDTFERLPGLNDDYEPPFTEYILVVGYDVPTDQEAVFDTWMRDEYITHLTGLPGHVAARCFQPAAGYSHPRVAHRTDRTSPQRLTLCDFDTMEAFESGEFSPPSEPSGVALTKCQLYKRLYPYPGFKHVSTLS